VHHAHRVVSLGACEVPGCHRARARLGARAQLYGMTTRSYNHIRGVLKIFGMLSGAMRGLPFERRVESLIADRSDLALIIQPMLAACRRLRRRIASFDKVVRAPVKSEPTCRHLMSVPVIGVLSVLTYVRMLQDPARFKHSRPVCAYLGFTPRQYQSGEVEPAGRISKCGDALAQMLMFGAAVVLMTRVKRTCALKEWVEAIAKRSGVGNASVELARNLSVILHRIWCSGEPFRWSEQPTAA
jgi:transposase